MTPSEMDAAFADFGNNSQPQSAALALSPKRAAPPPKPQQATVHKTAAQTTLGFQAALVRAPTPIAVATAAPVSSAKDDSHPHTQAIPASVPSAATPANGPAKPRGRVRKHIMSDEEEEETPPSKPTPAKQTRKRAPPKKDPVSEALPSRKPRKAPAGKRKKPTPGSRFVDLSAVQAGSSEDDEEEDEEEEEEEEDEDDKEGNSSDTSMLETDTDGAPHKTRRMQIAHKRPRTTVAKGRQAPRAAKPAPAAESDHIPLLVLSPEALKRLRDAKKASKDKYDEFTVEYFILMNKRPNPQVLASQLKEKAFDLLMSIIPDDPADANSAPSSS